MHTHRGLRFHWLPVAGRFLLLTAVFALTYTQSPLYTSNQNQYFLHGLARAGYGSLAQDWLANTLDPTPVFTFIVEWTYRVLHCKEIFYAYYALLMGVYLFSLLGIVEQVFPLRRSPTLFLAYLAGLFLVHSAGLRFALSRALGENWTYVLEDGVADQRLLGPVFQPSTFGVLLLLSIYLFLQRRAIWAVLCAVLAATLHPTYLLSAAALTFTYMLLTYWEERRFEKPVWLGGAALLAVAPVVAYVYLNFGSTPPGTTAQAQHILIDFRIPHHARVDWWFDATAVFKLGLVLAALWRVRKQRLLGVLAPPFAVAVTLTVVQVLTGSATLALLFPWRMSTWLAPLATALLLAWLITELAQRLGSRLAPYRGWAQAASLGLIALTVLVGGVRLRLDFARQAAAPERLLLAYVAQHKAPGEVYLIPTKMQDFRLVSGAPAYVEFKSIPYRDADVLEWYRRIQLSERVYKREDCGALASLAEEGVTQVVLPAESQAAACPALREVYADGQYGLYRLDTP
ncbi:MAG: DUF6798 domain-containing protein [Chloroflexota bacterium]